MTTGMNEPRHREYVMVTVDGAADAEHVAVLLERAAAQLRHVGKVDVQAMAYDQDGRSAQPTASLTMYFDRVERRRAARD